MQAGKYALRYGTAWRTAGDRARASAWLTRAIDLEDLRDPRPKVKLPSGNTVELHAITRDEELAIVGAIRDRDTAPAALLAVLQKAAPALTAKDLESMTNEDCENLLAVLKGKIMEEITEPRDRAVLGFVIPLAALRDA
jgi:hypothetical protein